MYVCLFVFFVLFLLILDYHSLYESYIIHLIPLQSKIEQKIRFFQFY